MRRNNLYLKWHSNGFQLKYHNQIDNYTLLSVVQYKITNRNEFLSEFQNILQDKKINMHLITDNITIIIDETFSSSYIEYLKELMKELSFNQINFLNIKKILSPKSNELIIDISLKSLKFYFSSNTYQLNIINNEYLPLILLYLKILPLKSLNTIKIFGTNQAIKNISQTLNNLIPLDVYYYSDYSKIPSLLIKNEF